MSLVKFWSLYYFFTTIYLKKCVYSFNFHKILSFWTFDFEYFGMKLKTSAFFFFLLLLFHVFFFFFITIQLNSWNKHRFKPITKKEKNTYIIFNDFPYGKIESCQRVLLLLLLLFIWLLPLTMFFSYSFGLFFNDNIGAQEIL